MPVQHVLGPSHFGPIVKTPAGFDIADTTTGTVWRFASDGTKLASFTLPKADLQHGLAADSAGNLYIGRYPSQIVKYSQTGSVIWTRPSSFPLVAVFTIGNGSGRRVGVTNSKNAVAQTYTPDGTPAGALSLKGDSFAGTAGGGVASTDDGRYVRIYDAGGHQTAVFGARLRDNDPMPMGAPQHFYELGSVAQLPGGRLLVTDARAGIMLFAKSGLMLGALAPSAVDGQGLGERSAVFVSGGYVYTETGPPWSNGESLVRLPLADVLAHATHVAAVPRLGLGAGLTMTNKDLYVQNGEPVAVRATFDPWWRRIAAGLRLCWTIRPTDQLRSGSKAVRSTLLVKTVVDRPAGVTLSIPRHLAPGAYEVDASVLRAGKPLSSTSLVFTVGAPWMRLELARLPAGAGWGGPSPARGLALASQLGLGAFRAQLDWSKLLDKGSNAPLDLSSYLPEFQAAAAEAARSGQTLIVQVGQGGVEKQLVNDGSWGARVGQLVSALKPYVHVWEAWNEPNATFGPAADYVTKILQPFASAVREADPTATVVGGSTVGVDLAYWRGIIAAGGLRSLDVAAIHPYTGHNRSWEENGTIAQLRALRDLIDRSGSRVPIWNTEQAWWSDGAADMLGQADNSARAVLWMHALGIQKWAYFIPEGGWGNSGVSFSAIQVDDHVKPTALAIMTAEHEVASRPFLGQISLGLDQAYALRFGPRAGDRSSRDLLVAWTDGLRLPSILRGPVRGRLTMMRELGATRASSFSGRQAVTLDSDPIYLSLSGPGSLTLEPRERFGPDLALGATATASSATSTNPARYAVDGIDGAAGGGDIPGLPMWESAPGDRRPWLVATLAAPRRLDRVLVATHSIGSIAPGLRDYDVAVRSRLNARWQTVAHVTGQFYHRQCLISFSPRVVAQLRVEVHSVNFGGSADNGLKPSYWPTDAESLANPRSPWFGPAIVEELAAYGPA